MFDSKKRLTFMLVFLEFLTFYENAFGEPMRLPKKILNQESKSDSLDDDYDKTSPQLPPSQNNGLIGDLEIRSVYGEPNYKSVNLTWDAEFMPKQSTNTDDIQQGFQIFYCELQSFGPHRCRTKQVNIDAWDSEEFLEPENKRILHYTTQIDNLRMATKYSFHLRRLLKRKDIKISGRSEVLDNDIDIQKNDFRSDGNGQTIVIPTKGFSAQATKCLPHASEIEVETGPYFAGEIVVDGGNCGLKGNPLDPLDKYVMRIDHKTCGSLVKPETNTVETFITVQENMGIFTHSTRRFVVVCSFQSGMQTVRASFSVPGKEGVITAVEDDPFEPDQRVGRGQRYITYVDKSALVLKEDHDKALPISVEAVMKQQSSVEVESAAKIKEDPPHIPVQIKDESVKKSQNLDKIDNNNSNNNNNNNNNSDNIKFAKLVANQEHLHGSEDGEMVAASDALMANNVASDRINARSNEGNLSSLHYVSANVGNLILSISLCVIVIGVILFITYREIRRQQTIRLCRKLRQQQQQQKEQKIPQNTLPRSLRVSHPSGSL